MLPLSREAPSVELEPTDERAGSRRDGGRPRAARAVDRGRAADAAIPPSRASGQRLSPGRGHDRQGWAPQASTRSPDVVLLDLGLPDMDGLEVTRRLREWSQVPIVVISARGREDDKVAALDAGADDYVTKPFGVARAARASARGAATRDQDRRRVPADHHRPARDRFREAARHEVAARRASHADRVSLARRAGAQLRQGSDPLASLRQVRDRLRAAEPLPARLHDAAQAKARGDPARPRFLLTEAGSGTGWRRSRRAPALSGRSRAAQRMPDDRQECRGARRRGA